MSREIRVERIGELGPSHYGRKRIQPPGRAVGSFYCEAGDVLKHPLLTLDEQDIALVAGAFNEVVRQRRYTCYACAIMPDHVHLVIRKHRDKGDEMISHFQSASAVALIGAGQRPTEHPVWGGPGWKVYLDSRSDVERTCEYVRNNPVKIKRPEQSWPFVAAYDGWLPGGHAEVNCAAKSQAMKEGGS